MNTAVSSSAPAVPVNGLLSTSSPMGIAAAAAVTPERIASLLAAQGPLAIRHITSHLAMTIPGFANLSLSKQRRLIIAALETGDPEHAISFEKVGWGQWAAKRGSVMKSNGLTNGTENGNTRLQNSLNIRRESITNPKNDPHNTRVPFSPNFRSALATRSSESAIDDDSSDIDENEDEDSDIDLADDDMMFHNKPLRRKRVNSQKDRQTPSISFPNNNKPEFSSSVPVTSNISFPYFTDEIKNYNFNYGYYSSHTSDIRNSPNVCHPPQNSFLRTNSSSHHSDTDEEDWQSIGAESLRKSSGISTPNIGSVTDRGIASIETILNKTTSRAPSFSATSLTSSSNGFNTDSFNHLKAINGQINININQSQNENENETINGNNNVGDALSREQEAIYALVNLKSL